MKKLIPFFGLVFLIVSVVACKKDKSSSPDPENETLIPNSFSYATTKSIAVSVQLLTNNNQPIAGAVLSVTDPADQDRIFLRAVSDQNGYVRGNVTIPSFLDTLAVTPNYIGLINDALLYIGGRSSVSAIIGGSNTASGDIAARMPATPSDIDPGALLSKKSAIGTMALTVSYGYPSPYTNTASAVLNTSTYPLSLGRPKYLETTSDVISTGLLNYVNASLPEGKPLNTTHPQYLTNNIESNIVVKETSDVWITFVSEGAGYYNSLAYYTYETGNPPNSVNVGATLGGIDKVTLIFPNASAYQSGGGLHSGNKVKLGRFNAGTTIAFVLLQNAWTSSGVNTNSAKFYSDSRFNPEISSLKKHSVLLHDNTHNLFLMGFEDVNRSQNSDNDFNDLVIYATSNPVTGISNENVAPVDKGGDTDGDTVQDKLDEFPNDPNRAFTSYFPSATGWATLAFEDNWPRKGDYDINDLVINYRYAFVANAKNQVVDMTGTYMPVAAGASYKNGFGVQFPFAPGKIASVDGQLLNHNYIQLAGNKVEAGQSQAVIIPFDSHENLLRNPNNSIFVNTDPAKEKVNPASVSVQVRFVSPISMAELGTAPFNPFLISDMRREYEVHLPNYAPTAKANTSLFGTYEDRSNAASNKYYLDNTGYPWALSFQSTFSYPVEGRSITQAYPHFLAWAQSGGTTYRDWYTSTANGYRNTNYIYSK
ncbi:LruC domain-containing protein [Pedobacter deserti]|uniref:LruC domain-containing protein n=1 Tax=Pedobacter deserti TaxID=2817382 RepID=UPI00210B3F15|nr:LruC domain-containing protein [Pedobacter sp. SYSU D00382]